MTSQKRQRRGFGYIRELPSGRYQASYVGLDLLRRSAPITFDAKIDAEAWLLDRRREMTDGSWEPPKPKVLPMTFREYATGWLAVRDLKPRSRQLYHSLLDNHILATFGDLPLTVIDTAAVKRWWSGLNTGPTAKSNAYGLLRTVMGDAADDGLIERSPVRIKGAGSKKRARELRVLTPSELAKIADLVPPRYKSLVLLGGWCSLRFGELAALRRSDLDLKHGVVKVRRAVTALPGSAKFESDPKSGSSRVVTIPPHVIPDLREHLRDHAAFGKDGLVFPPRTTGDYLALSTLHRVWRRAAATAGRPHVRPHDLRHFGAIMAARSGATLGELQQRLGHRSAAAAIVYQSAVSERPTAIAAAMSDLAREK